MLRRRNTQALFSGSNACGQKRDLREGIPHHTVPPESLSRLIISESSALAPTSCFSGSFQPHILANISAARAVRR